MIATVFLGPSMSMSEARTILPNAIYRPPAEQGDLIAALNDNETDLVGLIDGTFHQTLSVWHSEVCYLLSRGVTVFGASSMGALRAVETENFGTVGVGTIFGWYRDGIIAGDDEVALIHGTEEQGFRPISLPLVNIRASLYEAISQGLLTSSHAHQVIGVARSLYYPARHVSTILERCQDLGFAADVAVAVERALTVDHVDLKQADAREMLTLMRNVLDGSAPRPPRVKFDFSRSGVFEALYNLDRQVRVRDTGVSLQSIREHAALHCSDFEDVKRTALDRSIVSYFALLLGLRVTPEELEAERVEFLEQRGLDSRNALQDWLHTNGMSEADLSEYLAEEALCSRLRRWVATSRGMDRGCRAVMNEARMQGVFPHWANGAAEEQTIVGAYRDEPEYYGVRHEDPRWLAALHNLHSTVRLSGDPRLWAEDAGFDDVMDLIEALRRSAIFYDVKVRIARQLKALGRAPEMLGKVADENRSS
jgi:hypothetical protein